mgnify:CR=1 FL=1|tara:strand:+ start:649 stop:963 length:315 start_codon:yes stop_codon:yes gene_type:complete
MKPLFKLTEFDSKRNTTIIRIDEPEFKNIDFYFNTIKPARDPNEDGTYTITFEYETINENENIEASFDDEKKKRFESVLGNILNSILEENLLEINSKEINGPRT